MERERRADRASEDVERRSLEGREEAPMGAGLRPAKGTEEVLPGVNEAGQAGPKHVPSAVDETPMSREEAVSTLEKASKAEFRKDFAQPSPRESYRTRTVENPSGTEERR